MDSSNSSENCPSGYEVGVDENMNITTLATTVDANIWIKSIETSCQLKLTDDLDSTKYHMNHPERGKAVIFNHENFISGKKTRKGTEIDEKNLLVCLKALKFDVIVHSDLTKEAMFRVINKLREEDHSKRDCILIVVLSHGGQNKIYASDDSYRPEEIWELFAADCCPTLAGKPKIFFIQACRGRKPDGETIVSRTQTDARSIAQDNTYSIPNRADLLIVFSSFEGYCAFRDTLNGSCFVLGLTKVINLYKDKKDLLSMITLVNREVALNFKSDMTGCPEYDQKKQMPTTLSTLTRDIYF